jgi:leucyl aminopeptidase
MTALPSMHESDLLRLGSELPYATNFEAKSLEAAQDLRGVREMVILVDPNEPASILYHPTFGSFLREQENMLFIQKGEKKVLRTDPIAVSVRGKMGNLEILHLSTKGNLKGSPEEDSYNVPAAWRDTAANLKGVVGNLEAQEGLAIYVDRALQENPNRDAALQGLARGLGNIANNNNILKSTAEERYTDGQLPNPDSLSDEVSPEKRVASTRNAVRNVYMVSDSEEDALLAPLVEGDLQSRQAALIHFLAKAPHNLLTCERFVRALQQLTKSVRESGANINIEVYGPEENIGRNIQDLKQMGGLEVLKAVHRGSEDVEKGPFMVRIKYRGGKPNDPVKLVLGKSIMQDNGGHCAKGDHADDMQADMMGGATLAGLVARLGEERPETNVDFVFAIASNTTSAKAYEVNDVLTLSSGRRVEVGNTDAEGRLVLADIGGAMLRAHQKEGVLTGDITSVATLTGHSLLVTGNKPLVIGSNRNVRREWEDRALSNGEQLTGLPLEEVDFEQIADTSTGDMFNMPTWKMGQSRVRGAQNGAAFVAEGMGLSDHLKSTFVHVDIAPELDTRHTGGDMKGWDFNSGSIVQTLWDMTMA